ncbi:MAG: hypothetical protein J6J61_06420 [Muribaculaceae bacterium]|nr:hypothetical protein [Muribaculaceae bacterium]
MTVFGGGPALAAYDILAHDEGVGRFRHLAIVVQSDFRLDQVLLLKMFFIQA